MLLTDLILAKKGPLAKVWISAHHERKLTKAQALQVDVGETVEAILDQEVEPIALRMSGQLMLGVVRIYSRKVQYLFDDCKEARERIVMAFRPGAVDLPEDQLRASKAAITLPDRNQDFELMLSDLDWTFNREFRPRGAHVADAAAITLPRRFYAYSDRSFSVERQTESGLDSQADGEGLDLGLDLGDETFSLEFARRATPDSRRSNLADELRMARRASLSSKEGSVFSEKGKDAALELDAGSELDERPIRQGTVESGHAIDQLDEPIDLGLDMGEGFDFSGGGGGDVDMEHVAPPADDERSRRESADELGDVSQSSIATITPRTAARISKLAQAKDAQAESRAQASKQPPRKKVRVMALDEEIELHMERGQGGRRDTSAIVGKENYVPANEAIVAMMRVREDPQSFFMPTIKRGNQTYFVGGLPGMAPQLAELFTFPTNVLRRHADLDNQAEIDVHRQKRLKTGDEVGDEDEDSVEFGRREEATPYSQRLSRHLSKGPDDALDLGFDADFNNDQTMDMGVDMGRNDFDDTLDMGGERLPLRGATAELRNELGDDRHSLRAPSAAPSMAFGDHLDRSDLECPIAIFDTRPSGASQSQSQSQATASQSFFADDTTSVLSKRRSGYSQNTMKAEALLRRSLGVAQQDGTVTAPSSEDEKALSFQKVSEKGSRRAASSFFFELLVLGTRDSVRLRQEEPYTDITVTAKPGLWEVTPVEILESQA